MKEYKIKIRNIFIILITLILSPFLFFLINRKKNNENKDLKILIIPQLTRIGDLICSTPVFRAIKLSYPESHLSVLVSNKASGIIKDNTRINEIIIYEDYSFWALTKKIRRENFNWGFSLSATSVSTILFFLGLIKNRVKTTRENKPITEKITDWLNNFKLLYKNYTYLPKHHLDLLKFINITNPEEKKEIFFSHEGNKKMVAFLKENNVLERDKLVGISISAGNKIKEWGDGKFLSLAETIINKYKVKIFFLGSKKDEYRIKKLLENKIRDKNYVIATNFSLEDLPSLIKSFSLFMSADTGPLYIANAINIPTINIIGPVDPREQPPKEDQNTLRVLPTNNIEPTSFVFKEGNKEKSKEAVESISIEMVLDAVDKLLKI
ncbi:MAG: glycosyltransferase family 9 protein [Candidatus Paceibacterota bacterium]